jgi:integrase
MGRLNKSGVRGLVSERYFIDPVTRKKISAEATEAMRAAGGKPEECERYSIDLRYKDATGQPQRYTERLPDGTKVAAAKKRAQIVGNSATAGTLIAGAEKSRTFGEAMTEYEQWCEANRPASIKTRKTQIAALRVGLGESTRLEELSPFAIEKFKRERREEVRQLEGGDDAPEFAGHPSVNRGLAALKHAVSLFAEWGWMSESKAASLRKVKLLKESAGRVRHLTSEEEQKLLAALPKGIVQIVLAAVLSGMRRAELVTLKKSAVDLRAREITLLKTKNGKVRRVPINDALATVLKEAMAQSAGESVFVSPKGKPYAVDSVSNAFHTATVKAGIEDLHFHDCRHHFATMLRRKGVGLDVLQQLLGHATLAMTTRYAHVGRNELHAAVANLGSDGIARYFPDREADENQKGERSSAVG